jgi:hypothetical protein
MFLLANKVPVELLRIRDFGPLGGVNGLDGEQGATSLLDAPEVAGLLGAPDVAGLLGAPDVAGLFDAPGELLDLKPHGVVLGVGSLMRIFDEQRESTADAGLPHALRNLASSADGCRPLSWRCGAAGANPRLGPTSRPKIS